MATQTKIWIAAQPATYLPNRPITEAFVNPFPTASWSAVESQLSGFKIFSGTIYELSHHGYVSDNTFNGWYHPAAAKEVVELFTSLSTLNGGTLSAKGVTGGTPIYMESPVLKPGILPNGAHYNSYIEGFDGSFQGVIGYIKNSLQYAVHEKILTLEQAKGINIKYIAMDEPLFFASLYKTPANLIVDGVKIQSPEWSIAEVAKQAATALKEAKDTLGIYDPGLRFGDIEPIPFVNASHVDQWVAEFEKAAIAIGLKGDAAKLAFFQADVVWGVAGWKQTLQDVSVVLEKHKVPLNIIINGHNNETSAVTWADNALNAIIAINGLKSLKYDSLSVQNWNPASPTPLFDAAGTDRTPGTLANTAAFIPSLETVTSLYKSILNATLPSSHELFFSTRNIATDVISISSLSQSLVEIAPYKQVLAEYARLNRFAPGAKQLVSGDPMTLSGTSPVANALQYVPAGLALSTTTTTILPKVAGGYYYLQNVENPGALGSVYLHGGADLRLWLPNSATMILNFIESPGGGGRGQIFGGIGKSFVYIADGYNTFVLASNLSTIVDASGTGRTIIEGKTAYGSATIRGANGTKATLKITDIGEVALSSGSENLRVEMLSGSKVKLNNNYNVDLVVSSSGQSAAQPNIAGVVMFAQSGTLPLVFASLTNASQSVENRGLQALRITASGSAAGARLDGGALGIVIDVAGQANFLQHNESKNNLYRISAKSSIVLNDDKYSSVQLLKGTTGSVITIGAKGQSVLSSVNDAAKVRTDAAFLDLSTRIQLGGNGSLSVLGGGKVALGNNVTGVTQIHLERSATRAAFDIALSDYQKNVGVFNLTGDATLRLTDPTQFVRNMGTGTLTVHLASVDSAAFIDAGSGKALVKFTSGGTFGTNIVGRSEITLTYASNIFLNANKNLSVRIDSSNAGLNSVGIGAAGQSVSVENGKYACVYVASSHVGLGTGTAITGGGVTQLNIYTGGTVSLGSETLGIREIYLYKEGVGAAFSLNMSDYQALTTVVDVAGGSTVRVSEATQKILNKGSLSTSVSALAKDAGVIINGGAGGAILNVADSGSVVLANELYNVVVKLGAPAAIETGTGRFLRVDARVGGSSILIEGKEQVIETGVGNVITDGSCGSVTIQAAFKDWNANVLKEFGNDDVLRISDFLPKAIDLKVSYRGAQTVLEMRADGHTSEIMFAGTYDADAFRLAAGNSGGSILQYGS